MKTSSFKHFRKFFSSYANLHPISIALSYPKFYFPQGVQEYAPLMPTWEMVHAFREKRMSIFAYRMAYFELITCRQVTPSDVLNQLGHNVVLLCWESFGFCHRHLVSEWLRDGGIFCQELQIKRPKRERTPRSTDYV